MFPMRPDEAVATTTAVSDSAVAAMEGGSMIANLANFRKRPVAHYPDGHPLGKRPFLPHESEGLPSHRDVAGNRPNTDEGGLNLLFHASLLQQGKNLASTATDSWDPSNGAAKLTPAIDAAPAMESFTGPFSALDLLPNLIVASLPMPAYHEPEVTFEALKFPASHVPEVSFDSVAYFGQSHPNILDALGAHESSREACFEVAADSKRSVDIEPTASDGRC